MPLNTLTELVAALNQSDTLLSHLNHLEANLPRLGEQVAHDPAVVKAGYLALADTSDLHLFQFRRFLPHPTLSAEDTSEWIVNYLVGLIQHYFQQLSVKSFNNSSPFPRLRGFCQSMMTQAEKVSIPHAPALPLTTLFAPPCLEPQVDRNVWMQEQDKAMLKLLNLQY